MKLEATPLLLPAVHYELFLNYRRRRSRSICVFVTFLSRRYEGPDSSRYEGMDFIELGPDVWATWDGTMAGFCYRFSCAAVASREGSEVTPYQWVHAAHLCEDHEVAV
jgi:hypothetical protein